jgi:Anaphase-promoting complex subunit 1
MAEDSPMISYGPAVDTVEIKGNVVVCSSTLAESTFHKRTFDFSNEKQAVTQALFTTFSFTPNQASDNASTPEQSVQFMYPFGPDLSPAQSRQADRRRALVVVLKTLMHIIYPGGGSYIVHLPFDVHKVWSIPLGLLLDRHPEPIQNSILSHSNPQLPRLFTLSSPLEDFGTVTSSRSALDVGEELLFVSSGEDGIFLSRNKAESRLTIWHSSPDQQVRRKVPLNPRSRLTLPAVFETTVFSWSIDFQISRRR